MALRLLEAPPLLRGTEAHLSEGGGWRVLDSAKVLLTQAFPCRIRLKQPSMLFWLKLQPAGPPLFPYPASPTPF
jgi:hypothetical protein